MMPSRVVEAPPSDYPVPDEYIELGGGDPTPSTWFDQISESHARHAPLQRSPRRSGDIPATGNSTSNTADSEQRER